MRIGLITAFLVSSIMGCGAAAVHVPNPAATGTLGPAEGRYLSTIERSLAGHVSVRAIIMTDTARLVRLDGSAVCFDVTTRVLQDVGYRGTPNLTLDPSTLLLTYDGGSLGTPTIEPRPLARVPVTGSETGLYHDPSAPPDEVGLATTALNMEVVTAGGVVCFNGTIPASVRHLQLTYPQDNFNVRFAFALDASPAPSAWPGHPIVASGYERLAQ